MYRGGTVAHTSTKHIGSAARDAALGVAGLGAGGDLLGFGSGIHLVPDWAANVHFWNRTDAELICFYTRVDFDNYRAFLKVGGLNRLIITEADTRIVPSGLISMWHGLLANIPTGWLLCDGANGTPDLRSKFVRGAPAATEAGGTGGADTHTLITAEMPAHTHNLNLNGSGSSDFNAAGAVNSTALFTIAVGSTGGGGAHNNMPAYYQILYIMKV